jgi:leucine dehydrogenase
MFSQERVDVAGFERVMFAEDASVGYRCIVAIHSVRLGPALGGARLWHYDTQAEALGDALRLARGMTYKNALAGLDAGGGKSVLLLPPGPFCREELFRAHGKLVDSLGGTYITAEDVGTTPADMDVVAKETPYVGGLTGRSGDPSPHTARGVFRALQAAIRHRWRTDELRGSRVAIQGCGNVGLHLALLLHHAGAELLVSDIDPARAQRAAELCGARVVAPESLSGQPADIFAPCALGGIIDDDAVDRLRAGIVVGGANNQLLAPRRGKGLAARGILYVPDYMANAGGVISGYAHMKGWSPSEAADRVSAIYDTTLAVLGIAEKEGILPEEAADRAAEQRLSSAGPPATQH